MGAAVVLATAVGGLAWTLRGDAPPEVDAERALDQEAVAERPADDVPAERAEPDEPADDVDVAGRLVPAEEAPRDLTGMWTVDTTRAFDREAGTGSFVGYRIEEELSGVGANTAVGRSPAVAGTVVIDGKTVRSAQVEATLDALESDDGRRDNRVRGLLGQDAMATFELHDPIELPEIPPVGEVVELETTGTLTILDTARPVTVSLQAAVTADGLVVAGSVEILISDLGLETPSAPVVLSVSDDAVLEWQLFLTRDG